MNCFTCNEYFSSWDDNTMKYFNDENSDCLRKCVKVFSSLMYKDLMAAEDSIICEVCERTAKEAANLKIKLLNTKHLIDATYFEMTKIDLGSILINEDYDLNRYIKKERTDEEQELDDYIDYIDKETSLTSDQSLLENEENIVHAYKDIGKLAFKGIENFFRFQNGKENKLREYYAQQTAFQARRKELEANDLAGREINTGHEREDVIEPPPEPQISSKRKAIVRRQSVPTVSNQARWKLCGSCKEPLLLFKFAHIKVHVSSLHDQCCEIELNV